MCLRVNLAASIPRQTKRVAQLAFPNDTLYMQMRDELGTIFTDEDFASLYPKRGQPAFAPWRLALVTVMQVRGEPVRPAGGRGSPRPHRLEVRARAGADRPGLRLLGPE